MLRLAIRNLLRHRLRTAMTAASIVLGVVGVILAGGFVRDIYVQLADAAIHGEYGHLQIYKTGFYERGSRTPEKHLVPDSASVRTLLSREPDVANVMGRLVFSGILSNGRSDLPILAQGIEPRQEAMLGTRVVTVAGRRLSADDADGVMLGAGLARALRVGVGSRVTLLASTAEGAVNNADFIVVGIFQTLSKDLDARLARVPLAAAQDLLGTDGVNALVIELSDTAATHRMADVLRTRLAPDRYELKTWEDLDDFYRKTVDLYRRQFGVLQIIILAMISLGVLNSVNMTAYERIGEFGTMLALGNRSSDIFRLMLLENVFLAVAATAIGVLVGTLLALAISAVGIPMPPPPNSDVGYSASIRLSGELLAEAGAIGVFATIAAAIPPALRIRRVPVVEALRANA